MDPLSILSLVECCAGLSVTPGKLAIGLKSLADNYKHSALTFRSLSSQCRLFATSVGAIQAWMEEGPEITRVDDSIWEQLSGSLECANDAVYALENELVSTSGGPINTFWGKVNVVWNLKNMKDLEDCISKQIMSLSVILQIMNLPTTQTQTSGLREQFSGLQESRISSMSLLDSEKSTLRRCGDANSTIQAPSAITTRYPQLLQFDFDEMLLTSRVYLRYRNKTLAMNTRMAGPGKMQDTGKSVRGQDLPTRLDSSQTFDLRAIARDIGAGKTEKARMILIHYHEVLKDDYTNLAGLHSRGRKRIKLLEYQVDQMKDVRARQALDSYEAVEHETARRLALERQIANVKGRESVD